MLDPQAKIDAATIAAGGTAFTFAFLLMWEHRIAVAVGIADPASADLQNLRIYKAVR